MDLQRVSLMTFPMLRDTVAGTMNARKIVALAAQNGIGCLDLINLDEKTSEKYIEAMQGSGIKSGCYSASVGCLKSKQEIIEGVRRAVRVAKILGSEMIMLIPAGLATLGRFKKMGRTRSVDILVQYFRCAVDIASAEGISVMFENMPDVSSYLKTADECEKLLTAVPGLKLAFDSGNTLTCGTPAIEFYEKLREYIAHIHVRDVKPVCGILKTCCYGKGRIALKPLLEKMLSDGYDGLFAIEYCHPAGLFSGLSSHDRFVKRFLPLLKQV